MKYFTSESFKNKKNSQAKKRKKKQTKKKEPKRENKQRGELLKDGTDVTICNNRLFSTKMK